MDSGVVPLPGLCGDLRQVTVVGVDPLTTVHIQPMSFSITEEKRTQGCDLQRPLDRAPEQKTLTEFTLRKQYM